MTVYKISVPIAIHLVSCQITMNTFTAILLVSSIVTTTLSSQFNQPEGRIIGGSDAKRRQFPYMVSVQWNKGLWCGGTILSKAWVVSAAHCYEAPEHQKNLTAVAGLLHFGEVHPDVQTVEISEVINHPEYIHIVDDTMDNDISLLKLVSSFYFTNAVQPISLPPAEQPPSGTAWLSGWGIYQLPSTEPGTLQCLEMPIITKKECEYLFTKVPQPYPVLDTMVCVAPPNKTESGCFGDSGGPLAQNNVLIGITSWSSLICGLEDGPTVFTKVSSYIDFITARIKD